MKREIFPGSRLYKLRPRLAAVASLVPSGEVVADIGTDHAYLPIYLAGQNISPRVIAVEKSPRKCQEARERVKFYGLSQRVEVRVGDGLLALTEEDAVGVVIIAGLGGKTICRLLIAAGEGVYRYRRLVLQPMTDMAMVRRFLVERGFCFLLEKLAAERGRFYEVIAAEKGNEEIKDPIFFEVGPGLLRGKDQLFIPWLKEKLRKYELVLESLSNSRAGKGDSRWRYFNDRYQELKGVLDDVCSRE